MFVESRFMRILGAFTAVIGSQIVCLVASSGAELDQRGIHGAMRNLSNMTSFYAIADVPYTAYERKILESQLKALKPGVDFLVHLGDIKNGTSSCDQSLVNQIDNIMAKSPVPVLMVIGDNEYNDCKPDPKKALSIWRNKFVGYHKKHWAPGLNVAQMTNRPESFAFVNKQTLFIGLNLVGGLVHDLNEWSERHARQLEWVKALMLERQSSVHSVVLFGHADPGANQSSFFNPFVVFLRKQFPSTKPVLYLCGDAHKWANNTGYLGVPNFFRVRLTGGVKENINKVTVDPFRLGNDPNTAFQVERYLRK